MLTGGGPFGMHVSCRIAGFVSKLFRVWHWPLLSVFLALHPMAPHLSLAEQDVVMTAFAAGQTSIQIYDTIAKARTRRGVAMVNVTARRAMVETRGRKRTYSRRNVLAMDAARKTFIKDTKGKFQAKWDAIRAKARAPGADRRTVERSHSGP